MNKSKKSMRDYFFDRIYEIANENKDVVLVSADMSCPSIENFRKNLKGQYVDTGIAEQNAILVAAGLALSGKKTYVFSIMPFVTARTCEFTKIELALMHLPITVVGVGAGISYNLSGPTHHSIEDISIMRAFNLEIWNPSDNISAKNIADMTFKSKEPGYVRLDRQLLPDIYPEDAKFDKGFEVLAQGNEILVVSSGYMVHSALDISKKARMDGTMQIGVMDLYKLKPVNEKLFEYLKEYKSIISLEEHVLDGGLGSILAEGIMDRNIKLNLKRFGLSESQNKYGSREETHKRCCLDKESIYQEILKLC